MTKSNCLGDDVVAQGFPNAIGLYFIDEYPWQPDNSMQQGHQLNLSFLFCDSNPLRPHVCIKRMKQGKGFMCHLDPFGLTLGIRQRNYVVRIHIPIQDTRLIFQHLNN